MNKLDFFGVTDTEYELLAMFRSAILSTPRNDHDFTNDKRGHPTAYHLCRGYDTYVALQAAGYDCCDGENWESHQHEYRKARALENKAIETGSYALHKMRTRNEAFYPKVEGEHRRYPRRHDIKVTPLNLSQVLSHQGNISIDPSPYSDGIIELSSDNNDTVDTTYQTIYGAISRNKGIYLEIGDLGRTCYACGEPMRFGIEEQYPLLTKEQQESTIGRAWGLFEAFYKDIRSRRGNFIEIPTVDVVLMLVNGYGVFPEPEQVKGKKNKRKLTRTPQWHREVEARLQVSDVVGEMVGEDTRSRKVGNSKRDATETVIWIIVALVWCTPLNHLVPGIESLPNGFKLMGALAILAWGYRVLKL